MKKSMWVALGALALAGCGGSAYVKDGKVADTISEDQFKDDYIEVIGMGAAPDGLESDTQMRALSREAAATKAYDEILKITKGLNLTSDTTVENAMIKNQRINTMAQGMIRGAQITKTEYTEAGKGCVVTMRLNKGEFLRKMLAEYNK